MIFGLNKIIRATWSTSEIDTLKFDNFYTLLFAFGTKIHTRNGKCIHLKFNQKMVRISRIAKFSFQVAKPATTELVDRVRHAQTTPGVTQGWLLLKEAVIVCLPNIENKLKCFIESISIYCWELIELPLLLNLYFSQILSIVLYCG